MYGRDGHSMGDIKKVYGVNFGRGRRLNTIRPFLSNLFYYIAVS